MNDNDDPRVYFAAERTLLAWVRTGVTVIGLGFVVARFGLFLRLMNPAHPDLGRTSVSAVLGGLVTLFGAVVTALALVQFVAFIRELRPNERPRVRLSS